MPARVLARIHDNEQRTTYQHERIGIYSAEEFFYLIYSTKTKNGVTKKFDKGRVEGSHPTSTFPLSGLWTTALGI